MAKKVLNIEKRMVVDDVGRAIAEKFVDWDNRRQPWKADREEIQRYVFATDTTKTANSKLPWSNKTTIPKLCQIRDNLYANYMATMFPKRKNIAWEAATKSDQDAEKTRAIEGYMTWVMDRPDFKKEVGKLVLDYIDYGNCFVMTEWVDHRVMSKDGKNWLGYCGPQVRRLNPMDIVFDPTAANFTESHKVVRSIVSMGEIKEILERESTTEEELEDNQKLYDYMRELRQTVTEHPGETVVQDAIYQIAGFDSYRDYLGSSLVEVLTFYGDIYEEKTGKFSRNQIVKVVDRHKVLTQRDNPSFFGHASIYHAGWRIRPDNLWAMGPLDNLVGMQYRIDHLENIKADIFDLVAYPPLGITGDVDDFEWKPFERIILGDSGKVELLSPKTEAMQANTEIAILEQKMEEMAGSPKEAMGFRSPGEKTKYEVQRMENAASRIFQNKVSQFEADIVEPAANDMLELSRRHMTDTVIRVFDSELNIAVFKDLTPEDITGNGRVRPMAARHFAEQAQLIQDLEGFFSSAIGQDPEVKIHFSSIKTAKMLESLLDLEEYQLVEPFIRLTEQSDMQQMQNVAQERSAMNTLTASGIGNDYDISQAGMANTPVEGGPEQV